MRVKSLLLASTGAIALLCAAPAQAAPFYISVSGGANFSQDESGDFFIGKNNINALALGNAHADFNVDSGFALSGAVGFGLDKWLHGLSLEGEVGYRRNNVGGNWETINNKVLISALANSSGAIDANLSTFSLMANLWYEFDIGMRFKPYVGGGAGWARTKLDGAFEQSFRLTQLSAASINPFGGFNIERNGFAYQLGAGITSEIVPGTRLGIGYRYFDGPNIDLDLNASVQSFIQLPGAGHFKFDNTSTVAVTLGIDIN